MPKIERFNSNELHTNSLNGETELVYYSLTKDAPCWDRSKPWAVFRRWGTVVDATYYFRRKRDAIVWLNAQLDKSQSAERRNA